MSIIMKHMNRRGLMTRTGKVTVGAFAMSALSYQRVLGANERINLALVGCSGHPEQAPRSTCMVMFDRGR